jgi:hypothetical protein
MLIVHTLTVIILLPLLSPGNQCTDDDDVVLLVMSARLSPCFRCWERGESNE